MTAMPPNPSTSRFRFSAVSENREIITGVVLAADLESARQVLMSQYAHLLSLDEARVQDLRRLLLRFRDTSASLPVYTRALASSFEAGIPLTSMFDMVAEGDDAYLNSVMKDIASSLRQGRSLSASLRRWRGVFDSTFIGMCYAAERSGRLHHTIRSLAILLEKRWRLKQRMKSALTYPILVSAMALAIFGILVVFVVPGMAAHLHVVGSALPWPTRVLLSVGQFSTSLPGIMFGAVAAAFGVSLLYRVVAEGEYWPALYRWFDKIRLRLPLIGPILRLSILARVISTMAVLLETGLPMMEVLSCAGRSGGSPVYEEHLYKVSAGIQDGETLAESLSATGAFPPLMVGVAALGEQSGRLPYLLSKIAQLYEEDLEIRLSDLVKLVEPVILGVMGLVIGFIVLGTFLPMINLVQSL